MTTQVRVRVSEGFSGGGCLRAVVDAFAGAFSVPIVSDIASVPVSADLLPVRDDAVDMSFLRVGTVHHQPRSTRCHEGRKMTSLNIGQIESSLGLFLG